MRYLAAFIIRTLRGISLYRNGNNKEYIAKDINKDPFPP